MYTLAICLVDDHLLSLFKSRTWSSIPFNLLASWMTNFFPQGQSLIIIKSFYPNCDMKRTPKTVRIFNSRIWLFIYFHSWKNTLFELVTFHSKYRMNSPTALTLQSSLYMLHNMGIIISFNSRNNILGNAVQLVSFKAQEIVLAGKSLQHSHHTRVSADFARSAWKTPNGDSWRCYLAILSAEVKSGKHLNLTFVASVNLDMDTHIYTWIFQAGGFAAVTKFWVKNRKQCLPSWKLKI